MASVAFYGYGFSLYATHDRLELLDLPVVSDAADAACRALGLQLEQPADDRVAAILAGNEAIAVLVRDVSAVGDEALDDDRPVRSWLADWEALARSRTEMAARLPVDPEAALEVPQTGDGYPITLRMSRASGTDCERAVALAAAP